MPDAAPSPTGMVATCAVIVTTALLAFLFKRRAPPATDAQKKNICPVPEPVRKKIDAGQEVALTLEQLVQFDGVSDALIFVALQASAYWGFRPLLSVAFFPGAN